jgi:hypothetical protein
MKNFYRYCGRQFTAEELATIRDIIEKEQSRAKISRLVCQALNWRKPDGGLKDMSCRVALLRMQQDQLITLPPPRHNQALCRPHIVFTAATEQKETIDTPVHELQQLRLQLVVDEKNSNLFREFIQRYHYLGYSPLSGAQLRYTAYAGENILALLSFGSAAWTIAPRDQFIGWNHEQRKKNLHLVINNARFLLLPWIQVKNLGSKLLSMIAKRLPNDWQMTYGYQPVLIETFVETNRFRGTCYRAANWKYVGRTKGRGKISNSPVLPIKDILVYPLNPQFRDILCR